MRKINDIIPYINRYSTFGELLNFISNEIAKNQKGNYNLQSIRGNVFECLIQLIIFMKFSDFGKVEYFEGNANIDLEKITSLKQFLQSNIQSGNASGFSDVSFKKDNQWYISTSKYFLNNNKKLTDYDLLKLDSLSSNRTILSDAKYLAFVGKKQDFVNTFNTANTSSTNIYKNRLNIDNGVFGIDEIEKWYENLRSFFVYNKFDIDYIDKTWIDTDRKEFTPFYHQIFSITWLLNQIYHHNIDKKPKKLLLDMLQGQGKTYVIFGLMIENIKKGRNLNYLLTTNRPHLFHQWINPIREFLGLEKMNVIDYLKDRDKYTDDEWNEIIKNGNNFILLSIQAAKNIKNEKYSDIRNIKFDIEIRDESQEASDTPKTLKSFKDIHSKIKIFLSGTPQKNEIYQVISGYFDSIFRWTYFDLLKSQTGYYNGIKIDKKSMEFYNNIPDLSYNICEWSKDFLKRLHKKGFSPDIYPTPQKVFEVKNGKFIYEEEIQWWIESEMGDPLTRKGWLFDKTYINGTTVITLNNKSQQGQLKKLLDKVLESTFKTHIINCDEFKAKELKNIRNLNYGVYGRILLIVDQLRVGSNIEGKSTEKLTDKLDAHTIIKLDSKSSYAINYQTDGRLLRKYNGIFGEKKKVRVIDPWLYRGYNCYNDIIKANTKNGDDPEKVKITMLNSVPFYHNGTLINTTKEYEKMLSRYTDSDYYNENATSARFRKSYNLKESIENMSLVGLLNIGGNIDTKSKIEDGIGDKDKVGKTKIIDNTNTSTKSRNKDEKIAEKIIRQHMITVYNSLFYLPFLTKFKGGKIRTILNSLSQEFIYINKKKYNAKLFYQKHILGCNIDVIFQLLDKKCLNEDSINVYLNNLIEDYKKNNNGTLTEKLESIYHLIEEYRQISKIEKKEYGEVFSPFELINEMLDTLPSEVWSDPKLKWLDPANGIGNFPLIIVIRLMKGLKEWQPDEEKRYKHIIEKMIYVCDIQPKNNFIFIQLFGGIGKEEYKPNLCTTSFLNNGFNTWIKDKNIKKFDIIVGNFPYNDKSKGKSRLGSFPLWIKFINKIFTMLKENGYLVTVHPSLWRQANDKKCSILREKNIIHLSINDEKKGMKTFGAETRYDWYLLQNAKYKGNTTVSDQENQTFDIDLSNWEFIPNMMFDEIEKLLPKGEEDSVKILYSRSMYGTDKKNMSKEKVGNFKYPCIYMISKEGEFKFFYSNIKKEHFNETKVMVPPGRISSVNVVGDKNGDYGLCQFAWGVKCNKTDIDDIVEYMNGEEFKKIAYACSVSKLEYNKNIIGCFKKEFWK